VRNFVLVVVFLALGLGCGFVLTPYAGALLRGKPDLKSGDYTAYFRAGGPRVVLFSTSTCPYCRRTREYLAARHIAYDDNVIDVSHDANEKFKRLGEPAVPVVLTEHRKLVGFDPAGLDALATATD
jgi:glutaredoxin